MPIWMCSDASGRSCAIDLIAAGVDVGGTKVLAVAVGADGAVLAERRRPTPSTTAGLLHVVESTVVELHRACGRVGVVGVGLPGLVDRDGVLLSAPHLPAVRDVPVGALLAERLGRPVVVDNDSTFALVGEHLVGAARGATDAVVLTLGTGIGAGLLLGGQVARGASGFAGEVGHTTLVVDGLPCSCGRRGCWERYASGSALGHAGRMAAAAGRAPGLLALAGEPDAVAGEHVTTAARAGDLDALALVEELARWLAAGIGNLVLTLDVELVVLAGGLVAGGDVLLDPARRAFDAWAGGGAPRPPVRLAVAELGERAGAVGAGLAALRLGLTTSD